MSKPVLGRLISGTSEIWSVVGCDGAGAAFEAARAEFCAGRSTARVTVRRQSSHTFKGFRGLSLVHVFRVDVEDTASSCSDDADRASGVG